MTLLTCFFHSKTQENIMPLALLQLGSGWCTISFHLQLGASDSFFIGNANVPSTVVCFILSSFCVRTNTGTILCLVDLCN